MALEARIDADLQLGEDAGAGRRAAVAAGAPSDARATRLPLMLALYRSGRQAEALEVYQRTRAHLMGELGLEPGPELRALQTQILEQSPAIDGGLGRDAARRRARRPVAGDAVTIVIAQIDRAASLIDGLGESVPRGRERVGRAAAAASGEARGARGCATGGGLAGRVRRRPGGARCGARGT